MTLRPTERLFARVLDLRDESEAYAAFEARVRFDVGRGAPIPPEVARGLLRAFERQRIRLAGELLTREVLEAELAGRAPSITRDDIAAAVDAAIARGLDALDDDPPPSRETGAPAPGEPSGRTSERPSDAAPQSGAEEPSR